MSNYCCYICKSQIKGNIFKAYDKNMCSSMCRNGLINRFNFNNNFKLEEKSIVRIKRSASYMTPVNNIYYKPTGIKEYTKIKEYTHVDNIDYCKPHKNLSIIVDFGNNTIDKEIDKLYNSKNVKTRSCGSSCSPNLKNINFVYIKNIISNAIDKTVALIFY
jgi:hypothetical protein